jgi:hypothetical protein
MLATLGFLKSAPQVRAAPAAAHLSLPEQRPHVFVGQLADGHLLELQQRALGGVAVHAVHLRYGGGGQGLPWVTSHAAALALLEEQPAADAAATAHDGGHLARAVDAEVEGVASAGGQGQAHVVLVDLRGVAAGARMSR